MKITIVENNLDKVIEASDEAVDRALEIVGLQLENYVRNNCPEDTGLLRNSITSGVAGKDFSVNHYSANKGGKKGSYSGKPEVKEYPYVVVGSNVEYAPYQELGTSRIQAANNGQGFLRPAIEDHADELQAILKNELENA